VSPRRAGPTAAVFNGANGPSTLTDWAYRELKDAIVNLRLRPGEPLREAALAAMLNVSKTPIREALSWLERDGLVEMEVFKGAVVTGYSRRDLEEIYELRLLLEVTAARQAATFLEGDIRRRLVSLSTASRHALDAGNTKRLVQLIDEFDEILFDSLQNRRIRALIGNLRDHVKRIGHLSEQLPGRLDASVGEHERIIQAITDGDPEAAARSMREHILSVQAQQLALSDLA
jgi:GntR family transcriptional regulator, rspAB operon transcriptional repressor